MYDLGGEGSALPFPLPHPQQLTFYQGLGQELIFLEMDAGLHHLHRAPLKKAFIAS